MAARHIDCSFFVGADAPYPLWASPISPCQGADRRRDDGRSPEGVIIRPYGMEPCIAGDRKGRPYKVIGEALLPFFRAGLGPTPTK